MRQRVRFAENVQQLRRLVPVGQVPALARRRLDQLWRDDAFRASQEAQMEFLLGCSERAGEVAELARGYTEQMLIRAYMRWHPGVITRQRVKGIEILTGRDRNRPMILSFTHHHRYEAMPGSLARLGAPSKIVVTEAITRPEAGIAFAQHVRVARRGGELVMAELGTKGLAELLRPGVLMALAPDFPGRTPVNFLGRRVLGPSGTPRLAMMTDSPVALITSRRDEQGPFLQVHEPLEPGSYTEVGDFLGEILQRHGEAILDWPEAYESPRARFGDPAG